MRRRLHELEVDHQWAGPPETEPDLTGSLLRALAAASTRSRRSEDFDESVVSLARPRQARVLCDRREAMGAFELVDFANLPNNARAGAMIRVFYSNRFDHLVEALVADLEQGKARPGYSPLDPIAVVVRHRVEASYLKIEIARRTGIAANLRCEPLARFLTRAVEESPDRRRIRVAVAGEKALQAGILAVLLDPNRLRDPDLALIARYLKAAGEDEDTADLRRVQLARELADLFGAYLFERREMTRAWPEGVILDAGSAPVFAPIERFERAVWNHVFGSGGPLDRQPLGEVGRLDRDRPGERSLFDRDRPGERSLLDRDRPGERGPFRTLVEALEVLPVESLALPPAVHIFGLPALTPTMQAILSRIARRTEVLVYAENPCKEFWDDVDASGESPPLRLWGRAARERIRMLGDLVEWDFDARWSEGQVAGARKSLLSALQRDILIRRPEGGSGPDQAEPRAGVDDRSLVVLACPSIRREAEVIAAEIWTLVAGAHEGAEQPTAELAGTGEAPGNGASRSTSQEAHDPGTADDAPGNSTSRTAAPAVPLRFNQIAIVLGGGDHDAYRTHLSSVLAETFDIPHHSIDVPVRSSSRAVEAIELLLALPFSAFGRQDLLRLLLHPLVAPHVGGAAGLETGEWVRWLDRLAAVHGADHADHRGTYIEKDLYNWDQALKRLVLGLFLSGHEEHDNGDRSAFPIGRDRYLPYEVPSDRLGTAARLVVLVRSLIADARFARRSKLTLPEWADFIGAMIGAYITKETEQDERDIHRCLEVIHDLENLEAGKVSFRIASEMVKGAIGRLVTNHGQPLADAVVIGPLEALAAIPFKVVFLAGLGEGQFPAPERISQLDLRAVKRRRGDVSRREADELQFLERILATEERLYLSYVSREARTGDALEPSSVLLELLQILEREYVGPAGVAARIERHPLRRYDEQVSDRNGTRFWTSAASGEKRSVVLREHLFRTVSGLEDAPLGRLDLAAFERALSPERYALLLRHLGVTPVPEAMRREEDEVISVPFAALRWFLEDPQRGWKRLVLRLKESDFDTDPLARENETFAAGALDAAILLRKVLAEKLRRDEAAASPTGFADLYDDVTALLELDGTVPTGVFRRAERHKHLAILDTWHACLTALLDRKLELKDGVRFGRARESASVKNLCDPLILEIALDDARGGGTRRVRVELSGRTEPMLEPSTSLVATARDGAVSAAERAKLALRGFFDHLAIAALGMSDGPGNTKIFAEHEAVVLFATGDPYRERFSRFERDEAIDYLKLLLVEILSRPHAYQLPFEAVLEVGADPGRAARIARSAGVSEEEIARIIATRFGPYFKKRSQVATVAGKARDVRTVLQPGLPAGSPRQAITVPGDTNDLRTVLEPGLPAGSPRQAITVPGDTSDLRTVLEPGLPAGSPRQKRKS